MAEILNLLQSAGENVVVSADASPYVSTSGSHVFAGGSYSASTGISNVAEPDLYHLPANGSVLNVTDPGE